jgi:Zn finger protein HypA/HybF involved in hydrogenase expression
MMIAIANGLPTIDIVKHGEWKICCDGWYPYCSECGEESKVNNMTNYCPNCGADMR